MEYPGKTYVLYLSGCNQKREITQQFEQESLI